MGVPVYITIVGANSAADMAKVGGLWYGKFVCTVYAWGVDDEYACGFP